MLFTKSFLCVSFTTTRNLLNWLLNDKIYRCFLLLKAIRLYYARKKAASVGTLKHVSHSILSKNILIKFNWVFRHFLQNQRHDDLLHNCAINCLLLHKFSKWFPFSPLFKGFSKLTQSQIGKRIKSLNRYIIITICFSFFFSLSFIETLFYCYIMDFWFKLNVSMIHREGNFLAQRKFSLSEVFHLRANRERIL